MKLFLKSFLPFTVLLAGILAGVWYCDLLAHERSSAFIPKEVKLNKTDAYLQASNQLVQIPATHPAKP